MSKLSSIGNGRYVRPVEPCSRAELWTGYYDGVIFHRYALDDLQSGRVLKR